MRKLLLVLVVLLGLLVAADRVLVRYVDSRLAERMQQDGRLDSRPTVDIQGFPFLTQALRGRYDRTEVHIRDVTRSGLTLSRLDVVVTDALLPLSKVGSATDVPVRNLSATAVLTYYELAAESHLAGLRVVPKGNQVDVTGTVAGVSLTTASTVTLKGDRVVVSSLKGLLDFSVRIPPLPYGLRIDSAEARPDGVHLTASTGPTVLSPKLLT